MPSEKFPIDLTRLRPLHLDPSSGRLKEAERETLSHNIQLVRDTIVFFTALAGAKGLAGHTGGPYDTVPELMIIRAFIDHGAPIHPVIFDDAGPGGHFKFPHPWPGQNPPPRRGGTVAVYAL